MLIGLVGKSAAVARPAVTVTATAATDAVRNFLKLRVIVILPFIF
jgi:hypothetical protein